ncbi:hypothetical protein B0H66DRAFT_555582 [Apodospora peruviana]|uniref:Uncharacterized protein n=1 Tax=Apodospora peruviana TaxID=516989 RepID=A0AAE0IDI0_9PEZI|nr:hypothetical protein B0H66DRAFT_555582 [Apodospora peruviana]
MQFSLLVARLLTIAGMAVQSTPIIEGLPRFKGVPGVPVDYFRRHHWECRCTTDPHIEIRMPNDLYKPVERVSHLPTLTSVSDMIS